MKKLLQVICITSLLMSCKEEEYVPNHQIKVTCQIAGFTPLDYFSYIDYTEEGFYYSGPRYWDEFTISQLSIPQGLYIEWPQSIVNNLETNLALGLNIEQYWHKKECRL